MSSLYTYRTGMDLRFSDSMDADEHSVDLTIHYTVSPGCRATFEQPGEGPTVSIQGATITSAIGTKLQREDDAPDWMWPFLEKDAALAAELLAHAEDADEYARDQAAEARREERLLEVGR